MNERIESFPEREQRNSGKLARLSPWRVAWGGKVSYMRDLADAVYLSLRVGGEITRGGAPVLWAMRRAPEQGAGWSAIEARWAR